MDLEWVAQVTGARRARRAARLSSLWSGYGEIVRVELEDADVETVVVKSVRPPPRPAGDPGDARKRRSYDVERAFYTTFAPRCPERCRVARLRGGRATTDEWLFVLEDLDAMGFDQRKHGGDASTYDRCLAWLAAFHATFLGDAPTGLWKTGTYWHLATRREELTVVDDSIRSIAPVLDAKLAACVHKTFVHGDAKLANFCFARGRSAVAAVDFQYVGGGCGMKDVAYLLAGEAEEERALELYFGHLRRELTARSVDPAPVEAEWRALYPIACADFYRFLAGWAPSHFARDRHAQRVLREVTASVSR